MKSKGIDLAVLKHATKEAFGSYGEYVYKGMSADGAVTEGYVKVVAGPYRGLKANGTGYHYGPCYHGYRLFAAKVHDRLNELSVTGWRLWPFGPRAISSSSGTYSWSKVKLSVAAHVKCNPLCPSYLGPSPSASPIATPEPEPTLEPKDLATLAGDLLTDGEFTLGSASMPSRSVFTATATMYLIEELAATCQSIRVKATVADIPEGRLRDYYATLAWARRLMAYRAGYADRLARNFFDFLVLASYSEAAHSASGWGSRYTFKSSRLGAGGSIIPECAKYDPRDMLPKLAWAFRTKHGATSYGGAKWAKICDAAGLFYKFAATPLAFSDHCVDLAHNGGLAFNKGYILSNPSDQGAYMAMLDAKRAGSLLATAKTYQATPECIALIREAESLGLIPPTKARLEPKDDRHVPTVKWGSAPFTIYKGPSLPPEAPAAPGEVLPPTVTVTEAEAPAAPAPFTIPAHYGVAGTATLAGPR